MSLQGCSGWVTEASLLPPAPPAGSLLPAVHQDTRLDILADAVCQLLDVKAGGMIVCSAARPCTGTLNSHYHAIHQVARCKSMLVTAQL